MPHEALDPMSGDSSMQIAFSQFASAREWKIAGKIDDRFGDVLDKLKTTIDMLDALPRFSTLEPEREKLVVTCIAATREISNLRKQPFGDGRRFAAICDDLSTRCASFRRQIVLLTDVDP